MMLGRLFTLTAFPLVASLATGACGGDSNSKGGKSGGNEYTLDDVCAQIAPKLCAQRKTCCEASTAGYDRAGCEAHELADCEDDVDDVKAGKATFRPELIDGCLAKFESLVSDCEASTLDLIDELRGAKECLTIFEGELAEGDACTRDSQCKQPSDPDAIATCEMNVCEEQKLGLRKEGEDCSFEEGPNQAFCGKDLYCDVDLAGGSKSGTCKTATALGMTCDTSAMFSLECGLGAYCRTDTGVCTEAKAAGESCTGGLECSTLECDEMAHTCTGTGGILDAVDCTGTPT